MRAHAFAGSRRAAVVPVVSLGIAWAVAALTMPACSGDQETRAPTSPPLGARVPEPKVMLTVDGTGSTAGGTISTNRGGITCTVTVSGGTVSATGKCTQHYNTGTVLSLTFKPVGNAVLAATTGCTQAAPDTPLACQVTMDQPRRVSASFAPPPSAYTLTVSGGGTGSGMVTTTPQAISCTITNGDAAATGCSWSFAIGQSVTLTASAASGSYLKAWAGGGCDAAGTGIGGSSGQCTVAMSQAQSVVVSFETRTAQAALGRWDAPIVWPGIAIHAHLLRTGEVMTYGRMDHTPVLWAPGGGAPQSLSQAPADLFCSGHTFLPDGRLLVTGGHSGSDYQGILSTNIFDPVSRSWTAGPTMQNGRWYPTNTTLASGEVLTLSGGDTVAQRNLIPEVYQANGTLRVLTTASIFLPYYPFMFVVPDGRVYAAGSSPGTFYLNTSGTGQWTNGPSSNFGDRNYGSAVMYAPGKILLVGGGDPPTNTAEVIDLTAGGAWQYTAPMAVARRQLNATLLADGRVLATGGSNSAGSNAPATNDAVLAAELWNPGTGTWTTLARASHYRLYHSTALLLPDARVITMGSGQPAATGLFDDYTAEIFNPPYLFNADGTDATPTRPSITSAPSQVSYGQTFGVSTPNASSIASVTWIALGSVTHAFNESQRFNRLTFSMSGTGTLNVTAPAGAPLSPPGYYMLFLIDTRGVPSVAKIIRIG